ncbi:SPOR domain-containing protein [Desulfacinum infernum]|uniref:SPOR domain-containing protein n=1 Tax=Desulfacinum infernum TaxID=35837 RepID=UPI00093328FF|nr:SPOR domain-containing protein [Desulfacinum infernum]
MTPTSQKPVYVVQVGAFSRMENAERISRRLKERGFQIQVRPFRHKSLGRLYLVRLNPMPSEEEARKAADKIAALEKTQPMVIKLDKAP